METVELLVDCFYQYEERAEEERLDKEREELDKISEIGEDEKAEMLGANKVERKTSNAHDVTDTNRGEEEEEEVDPGYLNLEPENVVNALK